MASDKAVQFHDKQARSWEGQYLDPGFLVRKALIERLLGCLPDAGATWLDAGCGSGALARYLAESKRFTVRGVDASAGMIEVAQELASHSPARGRLSFSRVETIERLPYSAESFDGVLCSSVLEYLPEPDAALREIVRVLKPGGLVLVSVPNAASRARKWIRWMDRGSRLLGKSLYPFIEHSRNEYTRTQFEEVLRTFGFRTEEAILFGTVYLPFHLRVEHSDTLMFFRAVKSGLA